MFPWLTCSLCTAWSTAWSDTLLPASSNQALPLLPYTPVFPNQIKRANAGSPKENDCRTIKKQLQCCKSAMQLVEITEQIPAVMTRIEKEFPLQARIWAWPVSKPPWAGLGLSVLWMCVEDASHITQCVPSNISKSSGSLWIFLSKRTSEWQLAMAPHMGPQGRGVLDGNLQIFWNLIKSRGLVGALTRGMKRHKSSADAYRRCSAALSEPNNSKQHTALPILLITNQMHSGG